MPGKALSYIVSPLHRDEIIVKAFPEQALSWCRRVLGTHNLQDDPHSTWGDPKPPQVILIILETLELPDTRRWLISYSHS